ncbi:MAG: leucine-rich repeat domain-containing protein [Clostridia bacterium]|nr:leucine-rich repeat domain-containing protein [Clostridia bacterium]
MLNLMTGQNVLKKYSGNAHAVTIPSGIVKIGDWAFSDCVGLTEVVIPASVTEIGDYVFFGCQSLRAILLPDGVETIGYGAFCGCKALQTVTLPAGVKCIGDRAFSDCESLQTFTVPIGVKEIGFGVFSGCASLREVGFHGGLREIGYGAFSGCGSLQTVVIPDGVTSIGERAFFNCAGLQNLTVADTVTDIGTEAFYGCDGLRSIAVSDTLETVGRNVFPSVMPLRELRLTIGGNEEDGCKRWVDFFGVWNLALPFLLEKLQANDGVKKKVQRRVTNQIFREDLVPDLIKNGESEALQNLLSLIKRITPEEIDRYIGIAEGQTEIRAMLLEYKNRLYPSERLEKMEEIQMEKDFGIREKTLADYKKIFSIKKENGVYVITGYKGNEKPTVIPASIRGIPVCFSVKDDPNGAETEPEKKRSE